MAKLSLHIPSYLLETIQMDIMPNSQKLSPKLSSGLYRCCYSAMGLVSNGTVYWATSPLFSIHLCWQSSTSHLR